MTIAHDLYHTIRSTRFALGGNGLRGSGRVIAICLDPEKRFELRYEDRLMPFLPHVPMTFCGAMIGTVLEGE